MVNKVEQLKALFRLSSTFSSAVMMQKKLSFRSRVKFKLKYDDSKTNSWYFMKSNALAVLKLHLEVMINPSSNEAFNVKKGDCW